MAELLLDDFKVGAAGPVEMGSLGVPTRVRGVPGIQPDVRHEALDHPPDAVPGEWASLPGEHGGSV